MVMEYLKLLKSKFGKMWVYKIGLFIVYCGNDNLYMNENMLCILRFGF